jgi:dienelactone hydrolase
VTRAFPATWPGVVVVHEVFGLNDDIRGNEVRDD